MAIINPRVVPLDPDRDQIIKRRIAEGPVMRQSRHDYYVQLKGCTEIAGQKVDKDGKVKLTKDQAQYWCDQGALGEQAGEHPAGGALEKTKK